MTVFSKIVAQDKLTKSQIIVVTASAVSLTIWTYNVLRGTRCLPSSPKRSPASSSPTSLQGDEIELSYDSRERKKARVKAEPLNKMITQLKSILRLVIGPKEYFYAGGIALTLIARTICDLWLINNGTQIEAGIITADMEPKLCVWARL